MTALILLTPQALLAGYTSVISVRRPLCMMKYNFNGSNTFARMDA